jgi:hypothetical protein
LVSFEMICGIKDIKPQTKSQSICSQLKIGYNETKQKSEISMGIFAYCTAAVVNAISSQFCTILIKDIYSAQDLSISHVEKKLSILFFISTIVALPLILLFGRMADIMKISNLVLVVCIFEIIGHSLIIWKVD